MGGRDSLWLQHPHLEGVCLRATLILSQNWASTFEVSSPSLVTESGFYPLICRDFIPAQGRALESGLQIEKKKFVAEMQVSPRSRFPYTTESESLTPPLGTNIAKEKQPALAWGSVGWSRVLYTKRPGVQFPVRAHTSVWACMGGH